MIKTKKMAVLLASMMTVTTACGSGSNTENATPSPADLTNTAENNTDVSDKQDETVPTQDTENTQPKLPISVTYEAEEASYIGNVAAKSDSSYSGGGYATGWTSDGDACVFDVSVDTADFYDLVFISAGSGGKKSNNVYVDGQSAGTLESAAKLGSSAVERVYLEQGSHKISVEKSWGYINLDNMTVKTSEPLPADLYTVSAKLVNPNADDNAKRLMSYMTDIYGKQMLSGQYSEGMYGMERAGIWKSTTKQSAVLGLDLIEYSPSRVEHGSTSKAIENAIEFWNKGGIVTFCWHWNAPTKYITGQWYSAFYTDSTNINLAKIMNGEDQEGYDLLMADIDAIAVQLKRLQDEGVPVLWRPLHEASGGWFWWGASGAESYKKLYILLYEKLTNEYGLNNLIWLWNGQSPDWYPGDDYVDIIGQDIYAGEKIYSSQISKFLELAEYSKERKMVVLSENGTLIDPDLAVRDGAMWGFFATWSGEFVIVDPKLNRLSEQYTEESMVKKVYDHEAVITLDELPDLKNYPIHE